MGKDIELLVVVVAAVVFVVIGWLTVQDEMSSTLPPFSSMLPPVTS